MPYVVKRCSNYGYNIKNNWEVFYVSNDREAAKAVATQEYKYILEADPSLSNDDIDTYLAYAFTYTGRIVQSHGDNAICLYHSTSDRYNNMLISKRPDRTALLDKILK